MPRNKTDLNAVDKRSKEKNEQLYSGHVLVVKSGSSILAFFWSTAIVFPMALVIQRLEEGTATATAASPRQSVSLVLVALLSCLQQHPVKSVEQLGLSYTKFILVPWSRQC